MHILFLTDNFPPEVNAPASRTFEHCREWVKSGCQVTVITCVPNFPRGKVFDGYRNRFWQEEQMAGIRVIRVWSYITANEGFAKRILDYMSYMLTAFLGSLFVRRVDIVVGTSPQFFTACAAWLAAAFKRRPWVFELRDLWPESIRAVGAMRESRLLDRMEKLELFLYRRADRVVAVTNAFRDNLISRGIDGAKVEVVTNGIDLSRFHPQPKDERLVDELGLDGKFVAGYIGTHGMAHALDTVLDAARSCKDRVPGGDRYRFLLLGDGAEKSRLVERARDENLDNVIFVDSVPKDQVARYWSVLDASIIHLRRSDLFKTVIPSKLFECMGMAIPVLHGVEGESADIVTQYQVGLLFQPENGEALVDALRRLDSDDALREQLKRNGADAAQRFDRATLAADLLASLRATIGDTSDRAE